MPFVTKAPPGADLGRGFSFVPDFQNRAAELRQLSDEIG
jgi:hypothetical protein